jgi:hypothetical protein
LLARATGRKIGYVPVSIEDFAAGQEEQAEPHASTNGAQRRL